MKLTTLSIKKLEILANFFPELDELTTREIEGEVKYSHGTVFESLKELVDDDYLEEKKVGKTNVYRPVLGEESLLIFNFYMHERKEGFKERSPLLYKRLKEFSRRSEARCVILFGSYAKGEETEKSDVDVLCVSDEDGAEKLASAFEKKYNIQIRPVVVRSDDFKNIKEENETFYEDLRRYGIVIDGIEYFFKEVYKDEIS